MTRAQQVNPQQFDFKHVRNHRFRQALEGVPQAIPPIWFMRQAGRYHQHYQNLRSKYSFEDLCRKPELASEVALGPIQDFDFDVSILFSDLLFPLDALGMGLSYRPAPHLEVSLDDETIKKLKRPDEAWPDLVFQREAMIATRKKLPSDKSLIGFVGGPWTLFAYAIEGSHRGGLVQSKKRLRLFEPFCQQLLVPLLQRNIELQLEGGAEVVMLFDTAAGELEAFIFKSLILPQVEKLAKAFPGRLAYYARGVLPDHFHQHPLFQPGTPLVGLGLDHRWDLPSWMRQNAAANTRWGFVQGQFDESLLLMATDEFLMEAERYLLNMAALSLHERRGWVCGLGHGVLQHTPQEHVRKLVQLSREILGRSAQ